MMQAPRGLSPLLTAVPRAASAEAIFAFKVDPRNPDIVYSTSTVTLKSTDGAKTWEALKGAPGGDDYQNIWINPTNPDTILLTSDQGAVVTVNGGKTWSSWYNQPTAQFYHVITDNRFPYWVYGGQQESGSVGISSRGNDGEITFRELASRGRDRIWLRRARPSESQHHLRRGPNGSFSKYDWTTGQKQDVTPIPCRFG